uniref:carbonic anhydrase n=1 Tax=Pyrodinium bahamense TaxID=73915 RepID=A0A7S0F9G7_9DINO
MDPVLRESLGRATLQPSAIVCSCADSRISVEQLFDAPIGDLYVVRIYACITAGIYGTCKGGVIGSVEFCLEHAEAQPSVLLVLGHLQSDAVAAAVGCAQEERAGMLGAEHGGLLERLMPAARDALLQMPAALPEEVVAQAAELQLWQTVEEMFRRSERLRRAVRAGLQIHGAMYDVLTGHVRFCGEHPARADLCRLPVVPSFAAKDEPLPAEEALARLQIGNRMYAQGRSLYDINADVRSQQCAGGQNPLAVVVGCSDAPVPIELLFGLNPGDIFVLRNAGNVVATGVGSLVGSAEYAVGHLKTNLVVVLGHSKCGAIDAAVARCLDKFACNSAQQQLQSQDQDHPVRLSSMSPFAKDDDPLDKLLQPLMSSAVQAIRQLGPLAPRPELVALATELNVRATVKKFLMLAPTIKEGVLAGTCQVHGGIYDLASGQVRFLPPLEDQEKILGAPVPLFRWKWSPYIRQDCNSYPGPSAGEAAPEAAVLLHGSGVLQPAQRRARSTELFDKMDLNGDGVISRSEFAAALSNEDSLITVDSLNPMALSASTRCLSATAAMAKLTAGNMRYLQRRGVARHLAGAELREASAQHRQNPYAHVLAPSDGRVPVERLFDAEPGDLLVQRCAGNVSGQAGGSIILGTEWAVSNFEAKVLLVLGHTHDTSIRTALNYVLGEPVKGCDGKVSSIAHTTLKVAPAALWAARQVDEEPCSTNAGRLSKLTVLATELNVLYTMEQLLVHSPSLRQAAARPDGEQLELHGAIYNILTGAVTFIGQHPQLHELISEELAQQKASVVTSLDGAHMGG